jgi:hypothetical protein
VGCSPALSWYVTEKVKLVDVVPDPGDTDGPVRLPLSGQETARADAGNANSDMLNQTVSASPPTRDLRYRRRAAPGNLVSVSWVDHIRVRVRGQ